MVKRDMEKTKHLPNSDTIANIAKVAPAIADTPCSDILGLVIYDLPGRDCAAKASNGELKYNELSRYKSEYIDRKHLFPLPNPLFAFQHAHMCCTPAR